MRPRRGGLDRRRDAGAGTVLALTVAAVAAFLAVTVAVGAQAAVARSRAESAADLAALAAADVLVGRTFGVDPCARADRTATLNGARLVQCNRGASGVVAVEVAVTVTVAGLPTAAVARAVAGPPR